MSMPVETGKVVGGSKFSLITPMGLVCVVVLEIIGCMLSGKLNVEVGESRSSLASIMANMLCILLLSLLVCGSDFELE